jgi:hypothetical protein
LKTIWKWLARQGLQAREVNGRQFKVGSKRLLKIRAWKEDAPCKPARNRKKYGKCKISDERFYSYWVHGQVELIFQD